MACAASHGHRRVTMGTQASAADELPATYRTILDRVARLERAGARAEAARIRAAAIRDYSRSWDDRTLRRLERLGDQALVELEDREGAGTRRPRPAVRRRLRWMSPGVG